MSDRSHVGPAVLRRWRYRASVVALGLAASTTIVTGPAAHASGHPDSAVDTSAPADAATAGFQNPQHDGHAVADLAGPLTLAWTKSFLKPNTSRVSAPLIRPKISRHKSFREHEA